MNTCLLYTSGFNIPMDDELTLVLNENNPLVASLDKLKAENREEDLTMVCEQIYDLAMLAHKQMTAEELTRFIERSGKILEKVI